MASGWGRDAAELGSTSLGWPRVGSDGCSGPRGGRGRQQRSPGLRGRRQGWPQAAAARGRAVEAQLGPSSPREPVGLVRGAPVQNLHWSRSALGDRSLAGRDRSPSGWVRRSLMRPLSGTGLSDKDRSPGTGLSGKDRFPNAKIPLLEVAAFGTDLPELGPVPHCENAQRGLNQKMKS
uniref:Uncharacterized protein n=1 Tax=Ananas comosus var. bracteatus TaxID=296719 RepID=A0A6V7PS36_ANACO|nr:unnamed protein product [Ananas comosus var. bracteatus]